MPIDSSLYRTPGQFLKALLDDRGWTQETLAVVAGLSPSQVARLVGDRVGIDAQRALTFSAVFDVPAERLLELQRGYDLAIAKLTAPPDLARIRLFGSFPVSEMAKRGWLPGVENIADIGRVEGALTKFFGVPSADDIPALAHAPRRSNGDAKVTPVQLAWLYRVRQIASQMVLSTTYAPTKLRAGINKLSALLWSAEEARHVPKILAECGVRFVLVEALPGSRIDGACFWLGERAPVIGMSLRFDRIDHFWFVLRHECEHVLRGHGKVAAAVDTDIEKDGIGAETKPEEERLADEAASAFCVPPKKLESFIARKAPVFAQRDIIGFASTIKVHPGIVAGQLQHSTGKYERFRGHMVKVRSVVAPSAVVDGWGDVAPIAAV